MVGPSNMPHRSPWTSRRSSRATSRPSSISSDRVVRRASEASTPGSSRASTTWGRVGAGMPARPGPLGGLTQGGVDGRPLTGPEVPAQAGHGQRRGQDHPARRRSARRSGSVRPPRPTSSSVSSGIEPDRTPGTQRHRLRRPRPGPAARTHPWGRPPRPGGRRPPAATGRTSRTSSCPGRSGRTPRHVGIGDHALAVEDEGVVDEGATQHVPSDQDTLVAQPGLADQRVGGTEVPGGGHVGRDPGGMRRSRQAPSQGQASRRRRRPARRRGGGARSGPDRRPARAPTRAVVELAPGVGRQASRSPRTGTGRDRRPARCRGPRRSPSRGCGGR